MAYYKEDSQSTHSITASGNNCLLQYFTFPNVNIQVNLKSNTQM